jgi:hypothetical protein
VSASTYWFFCVASPVPAQPPSSSEWLCEPPVPLLPVQASPSLREPLWVLLGQQKRFSAVDRVASVLQQQPLGRLPSGGVRLELVLGWRRESWLLGCAAGDHGVVALLRPGEQVRVPP